MARHVEVARPLAAHRVAFTTPVCWLLALLRLWHRRRNPLPPVNHRRDALQGGKRHRGREEADLPQVPIRRQRQPHPRGVGASRCRRRGQLEVGRAQAAVGRGKPAEGSGRERVHLHIRLRCRRRTGGEAARRQPWIVCQLGGQGQPDGDHRVHAVCEPIRDMDGGRQVRQARVHGRKQGGIEAWRGAPHGQQPDCGAWRSPSWTRPEGLDAESRRRDKLRRVRRSPRWGGQDGGDAILQRAGQLPRRLHRPWRVGGTAVFLQSRPLGQLHSHHRREWQRGAAHRVHALRRGVHGGGQRHLEHALQVQRQGVRRGDGAVLLWREVP